MSMAQDVSAGCELRKELCPVDGIGWSCGESEPQAGIADRAEVCPNRVSQGMAFGDFSCEWRRMSIRAS